MISFLALSPWNAFLEILEHTVLLIGDYSVL
jgi:hypothetical protein